MTARKGKLIAIDGCAGDPVKAAARGVAQTLRAAIGSGGVSGWDASGIFTEISSADSVIEAVSARTLTLLYAADLAFRVRWQIGPALEAGESVIAAPYVESAKALAIAAGLPRKWLDELFAFAPKPSVCYRVSPARAAEGARSSSGYVEWFTDALTSDGNGVSPANLRAKSAEYLDALQARRSCRLLTPQEIRRLSRGSRRRR